MSSIEDAFVMTVNAIRFDRVFRDVSVLVFCEQNYANDANWLYGLTKRISTMQNVRFISDNEDVKIGVLTTELSKLRGYDIMKTYISIGAMKFYRNLITINNDYQKAYPGPNAREAMKNLLIQQIEQLRQYGKKKLKGPNMVCITGIHDEDGKRLPYVDDTVVAFIIFCLNATRFFKKDFPNVDYNEIYRMRHKIMHVEEEFGYINKNVQRRVAEHNKLQTIVNKSGLFS